MKDRLKLSTLVSSALLLSGAGTQTPVSYWPRSRDSLPTQNSLTKQRVSENLEGTHFGFTIKVDRYMLHAKDITFRAKQLRIHDDEAMELIK